MKPWTLHLDYHSGLLPAVSSELRQTCRNDLAHFMHILQRFSMLEQNSLLPGEQVLLGHGQDLQKYKRYEKIV